MSSEGKSDSGETAADDAFRAVLGRLQAKLPGRSGVHGSDDKRRHDLLCLLRWRRRCPGYLPNLDGILGGRFGRSCVDRFVGLALSAHRHVYT